MPELSYTIGVSQKPNSKEDKTLARHDHSPKRANKQEFEGINQLWETEIVPQLPVDLEVQAKQHGAFQRRRQIGNAYDLLRAILAYALGGLSTRQWGAWAVITGLADISDRAWSKWLQKSEAWLLWLFNELIALEPGAQQRFGLGSGRVLLIDASTVRQVGGTGDDWRLHTAYDLQAGRLHQSIITDRSQGEKLAHFALQPGDLVVTDGGYGFRVSVATVKQQQADGLFRFHPDTCPLTDEAGQPLDLWSLLRQRKGPPMWTQPAYCTFKQQRYRVRVIACKLPPAQAGLARKRLEKRARKKQRPLSLNSLVLAGWLLLITTLDEADWPAADLLRLYRARWQIELLFKRMKQMLKMHHIPCKRPDSVQATIRALLVAWLLQEQQAVQVRSLLEQVVKAAQAASPTEPSPRPISYWSLTHLSLQTLRHQVIGHWSLVRLRACLPRLQRFLTTKRLKRGHQQTDICHWLERRSIEQSLCLHQAA